MGNWFSNMSIRTGGPVTVDAVAKALCRIMDKRGYEPAAEADADGVAALVGGENAEWITVCTELLTLAEPEIFAEVGTVLSRELHTDVLGIACFDSDFLWLNLLNADENVDGWVGIGSGKELGFTRRNKLTPWKKKVRDYARFAQCAREEYVLADSFLRDTADCLGLPVSQSWVRRPCGCISGSGRICGCRSYPGWRTTIMACPVWWGMKVIIRASTWAQRELA